jgi:hypothetical protein
LVRRLLVRGLLVRGLLVRGLLVRRLLLRRLLLRRLLLRRLLLRRLLLRRLRVGLWVGRLRDAELLAKLLGVADPRTGLARLRLRGRLTRRAWRISAIGRHRAYCSVARERAVPHCPESG